MWSSLISLFMAYTVKATIVPWGQLSTVNYQTDKLQFNISQLFDVSGANGLQCTTINSLGQTYNRSNFTSYKDYSGSGFQDQPEIAEFISNTTYYAVFENSWIFIQNISLDGQNFTNQVTANFNMPGADAVCTDIALNKYLNRIYIACMSNLNSVLHTNIYIVEVDANTGARLNLVTVTQLESNPVKHKVQIKLVDLYPMAQGGQITSYVIVYDQGVSSALGSGNSWLYALTGARSGNLNAAGFVMLNSGTGGATIYGLQDVYEYQHQLLVMGRTVSGGPLSMVYCNLGVSGQSQVSVNCSNFVQPTVLNTITGYVGIMNTGQYVEINNDSQGSPQTVAICDIISNFYDSNFINKAGCNQFTSFKMPQNVDGTYITAVEGNIHHIIVKYCYYDSTYAGYSIHSFDYKYEYVDIQDSQAPHVIPMGKTFVYVTKNSAAISRQVDPYYYVNLFNATSTLVETVQCWDLDTPPTNVTVTINYMGNMNWNASISPGNIPAFSVYEGHHLMYQIRSEDIVGNDLNISVTFDQGVQNFTEVEVLDMEKLSIVYETSSLTTNFKSLYFSDRYALVMDSNNKVGIFNCSFDSFHEVTCVETAVFGVGTNGLVLQDDLLQVYEYIFVWGQNVQTNTTTVLLYDNLQNTFHVNNFRGIATDATMVQQGNSLYLVLAYQNQGVIMNFNTSVLNPTRFNLIDEIDQGMSTRQYFCPQNVTFDPVDPTILEVLSICTGNDQRILRYRFPPYVNNNKLYFDLLNTVPINLPHTQVQACSMGLEYIIWSYRSNVYMFEGYNLFDDRSKFTFGTTLGDDDFELGSLLTFSCVQQANMFTVVSKGSGANPTKTLSVWWGNNQYLTNKRLYKTMRSGLDSYTSIKSYKFMGQVLTVLGGQGYTDYLLTFSRGPILNIKFLHGVLGGQSNQIINMYIEGHNIQNSTGRILTPVEILAPHTLLNYSVTQQVNGISPGLLDIENYIQIKGDVLNAYLSGPQASKAVLYNRFKRLGAFRPSPPYTSFTYEMLETYNDTTIGVHTNQYNNSVMSIFYQIDEFAGYMEPAHGIEAFHFAQFPYDPTLLLFAYNSANVTNNTLQFIVISGNSRVAIGSSKDTSSVEFDKIRVYPLYQAANPSFLVVGHSSVDMTLVFYQVTVNNQQILCSRVHVDTNVHSFGGAAPKNSRLGVLIVYTVGTALTQVQFEAYPYSGITNPSFERYQLYRKANSRNLADIGPVLPPYNIINVECKPINNDCAMCLLNTLGTQINEFVLNISARVPITSGPYVYYKLPGFDGRRMDGNKDYIMYSGSSFGGADHFKYIAYQRVATGGTGDVFYVQDGDRMRPFTITTCRHGMTHFQHLSPFPSLPLFFLQILPMSINITEYGVDYSQIFLNIESLPGAQALQIPLSALIGTSVSSVSWWPFAIILGVLILTSIVYIIYNATKSKDGGAEGATEKYASLKA
jgi:hypothetical protein